MHTAVYIWIILAVSSLILGVKRHGKKQTYDFKAACFSSITLFLLFRWGRFFIELGWPQWIIFLWFCIFLLSHYDKDGEEYSVNKWKSLITCLLEAFVLYQGGFFG